MKTQRKSTKNLVREIMSSRVHCLMVNDTIHDAVAMMIDNGLTTVPVIDDSNRCIGILSRSDLTELFMQEDHELAHALDSPRSSLEWLSLSLKTTDDRLVKEVMTYEVKTIGAGESMKAACQEMVRQKIHHLPVVDEQGLICGIVSAFDIVQHVADAK